jgi:predicted ABC-type transport system involved in lysophospholipase L1 biosynthesis ATPase subunit
MTALDNVVLPAMLDGMSRHDAEKRARELLDDLGVGARADHRPDALSGGEQQRVAIARALFFSPSVVLADEPTGNLDSASGARLFALLREIAKERSTLLLMVTHEAAAAANCERVIVLRDGVVAGEFDTRTNGSKTNEEGALDAGTLALRAQELARAAR